MCRLLERLIEIEFSRSLTSTMSRFHRGKKRKSAFGGHSKYVPMHAVSGTPRLLYGQYRQCAYREQALFSVLEAKV